LPLPRALGTMPGHQDQEWPLRRLGVVFTRQPAAPTPLRPTPGSANSQAIALASTFRRRLEALQQLADPGTAGGPHHRGSEVPEPATPGPIRSADRPAVFDSDGICGECGSRSAECRDHYKSPANKGDFAIHLGYTPEYHRSITGAPPSEHRAGKPEGRQTEEWRMRQAQGGGRVGSAARAEACAIPMGALPEYYPACAVAGSP